MDAILFVLRTGCAWRHMPHDLPNPKTCWSYFNRFSGDGTWRTIAETLHPAARVRSGRDARPSQAVIDAQSVKTTKKGGLRERSATTRANA
jgi:putative transposase